MSSPIRILSVDDEPQSMEYVRNALKREGFEVMSAPTTQEAKRQFYLPGFSLIVLDRMMPPGEILGGSTYTPDENVGYTMLRSLRQIPELHSMPVIIFTNRYDARLAEQWEDEDERLVVRSKRLKPEEFLEVVKESLRRWPFMSDHGSVPPNEHPNVAPYYVLDVDNGTSSRVVFDHCEPRDLAKLDTGQLQSAWEFHPIFASLFQSDDLRPNLLKLVRESDLAGRTILGLYYGRDPRSNRAWWEDVLFETAPTHKRESKSRKLKGLGLVLVARFLRESLFRRQALNTFINLGVVTLTRKELELGKVITGREFLQNIGFRRDTHSQRYSIEPGVAQEILRRTSKPQDIEE